MLYECPTCGREVSENAQTCPKCGEPNVGKKAKDHHEFFTIPQMEAARRESEKLAEKNRSAMDRGALIGFIIGSGLGAFIGFSNRISSVGEFFGTIFAIIVFGFIGAWIGRSNADNGDH